VIALSIIKQKTRESGFFCGREAPIQGRSLHQSLAGEQNEALNHRLDFFSLQTVCAHTESPSSKDADSSVLSRSLASNEETSSWLHSTL
jgi:hypothetical protein